MLAAGFWNISPEFVDAAPNPSEMLQDADAALIIGDPALRIAVKMDTLSGKSAERRAMLPGRSGRTPGAGIRNAVCLRCGAAVAGNDGQSRACWRSGPGGREAVTPELLADFQASKEYGVRRIREIAEAASVKLDLPIPALERYLTENIDFDLGEENLAGLRLYFEKAAAARPDPAQQAA